MKQPTPTSVLTNRCSLVVELSCFLSKIKWINLPTVGVFAALREAEEDMEEMLSARAKGAAGGGLELEVNGGLNGLG